MSLRLHRRDRIEFSKLSGGLLHVVVFGPGTGEAIVVVFPDGTAGVIDGCRDNDDPVLHFLNNGGVKSLRFVYLTHPHIDHYRGMKKLLETYRGQIDDLGMFHPASPRGGKALATALEAIESGGKPLPESSDGLRAVVWEIFELQKTKPAAVRFLQQRSPSHDISWAGGAAKILGCAPAHGDTIGAMPEVDLAIEAAKAGTAFRTKLDPNMLSAALTVTWNQTRILLGGDLILGAHPFQGWSAAEELVPSPIHVVKASHHASSGAHHDNLWKRINPQLTIVTPFHDGDGDQPPKDEDIIRLAAFGPVAMTAPTRNVDKAATDGKLKRLEPPVRPAAVSTAPSTGGRRGTRAVPRAEDCAVAVALDDRGNIQHVILAGQANVFELPV